MRIFLSHSSSESEEEKAGNLEEILSQKGHTVFLSRKSALPALEYRELIKDEITSAELFVFFISPPSVQKGRYTLTELRLAKEKWRDPSGYVLPVMSEETEMESLPKYLRQGVTILRPEGNFETDVSDHIELLRYREKPVIEWRMDKLVSVFIVDIVNFSQYSNDNTAMEIISYLIKKSRNVFEHREQCIEPEGSGRTCIAKNLTTNSAGENVCVLKNSNENKGEKLNRYFRLAGDGIEIFQEIPSHKRDAPDASIEAGDALRQFLKEILCFFNQINDFCSKQRPKLKLRSALSLSDSGYTKLFEFENRKGVLSSAYIAAIHLEEAAHAGRTDLEGHSLVIGENAANLIRYNAEETGEPINDPLIKNDRFDGPVSIPAKRREKPYEGWYYLYGTDSNPLLTSQKKELLLRNSDSGKSGEKKFLRYVFLSMAVILCVMGTLFYKSHMAFKESEFREALKPRYAFSGDYKPVENVNWYEASSFCKIYQEFFDIKGVEIRLPTEAEWEWAAKSGGPQTKFVSAPNSDGHTDECKNTIADDGKNRINGVGLWDMQGNVAEWVEDEYNKNYDKCKGKKGSNKNGSKLIDPKCTPGHDGDENKVSRGGSWHDVQSALRVEDRDGPHPLFRSGTQGFRMAFELPDKQDHKNCSDFIKFPGEFKNAFKDPGNKFQAFDAFLKFKKVRKGTFEMGSAPGNGDIDEQRHLVEISKDFCMSEYEVIQKLYNYVYDHADKETICKYRPDDCS